MKFEVKVGENGWKRAQGALEWWGSEFLGSGEIIRPSLLNRIDKLQKPRILSIKRVN